MESDQVTTGLEIGTDVEVGGGYPARSKGENTYSAGRSRDRCEGISLDSSLIRQVDYRLLIPTGIVKNEDVQARNLWDFGSC